MSESIDEKGSIICGIRIKDSELDLFLFISSLLFKAIPIFYLDFSISFLFYLLFRT